MNGNYSNPTISPFSVPPPNYNQRAPSWSNDWRSNQAQSSMNNIPSNSPRRPQLSNYSRLSSPQTFQNPSNVASTSQENGRYSNTGILANKRDSNEEIQRTNGDVSTISVPPPPLPPYMGNGKTPMYNTQHMYSNRLPTSLAYHGPVAYVPIPTAAHHSYYLPSTHNPPLPPPPPPPVNHYPSTSMQRSFYYKRKALPDMDYLKKINKKRKKPLSQNIPQRKEWSVEAAKKAIEIEKEYNKRKRYASLIIKFPDTELNRDIVAKFHPSIDTVHFQQPSTPRFCFITLKDDANTEEVIDKLNKTRYGQGFLSVEYKKDREEDMNIGPEDIDPFTLYVGNLAQDVMKEDMVKIYPKHKRVDIGYAKKMKYTRYAFVSFKNVEDSIEAFKNTHSTQLYSKSLIVRFRRLHGTVGMPGEPKPQLPQKHNSSISISSHEDEFTHDEGCNSDIHSELSSWDMLDVSHWDSDRSIKQEQTEEDSEDENDENEIGDDRFGMLHDMEQFLFENKGKLSASRNNEKISLNNSFENKMKSLSPTTNVHISDDAQEKSKTSNEEQSPCPMDTKPTTPQLNTLLVSSNQLKLTPKPFIEIKQEKIVIDEEKNTLREVALLNVEIKRENTPTEMDHIGIDIKPEDVKSGSETQPVPEVPLALSTDVPLVTLDLPSVSEIPLAAEAPLLSIKNEPIEQGEEEDEDENGDDDDDDINFGDLLTNLAEKAKNLKNLKNIAV